MAIAYLHEDIFQLEHPEAFATWRSAVSMLRAGPEQNADLIGHECRTALLTFADDLVRTVGLETDPSWKGPIDRLRAVMGARKSPSKVVRSHLDAMLAYWGTTLDLAHRQEHGATKEGEDLAPDDARRIVFHTLVVMYEWDHFLRAERGMASSTGESAPKEMRRIRPRENR